MNETLTNADQDAATATEQQNTTLKRVDLYHPAQEPPEFSMSVPLDYIERHLSQGYTPEEVAVLIRWRFEDLRDALLRRGLAFIPAYRLGPSRPQLQRFHDNLKADLKELREQQQP